MRYVIRLERDGTVRAHTEGVTGPACMGALPMLEDLLEATVVDSAFTADYQADAATRRTAQTTDSTRLKDQA